MSTWGDEMPAGLRHRVAGAAFAAALTGAPLGVAGAGYDDPLLATGPEVNFHGGMPFTCTSKPDQARLSVPAETSVRFVNRTGHPAVLGVDGRDAGTVGKNQQVPVLFHRGPVTVSLVPDCGLNLKRAFGSVNVEVAPLAAVEKPEIAGSAPPGARAPEVPAAPSGLLAIGDPGSLVRGNVAVSAPVPAPPARSRANGLLALVAAVCAIGIGAAVIRAILSQRASRALIA